MSDSEQPDAPPADDALAPRPLPPSERDPWPSFLRTMAWVGINTFGGPVAQIGVMQRVAVEQRHWLTDAQFIHLINFAHILPGPEALEVAIHLGYLRRGVLGGIAAGLLFIWPGFVSLTALAWVYRTYGHLAAVDGFLGGVRPVAMALVAAAAVRLSRRALRGGLSYAVMAAAFLASYVIDAPYIAILVGSGLLGLALGGRRSESSDRKRHGWLFAVLVLALVGGTQLWRHRLAPVDHAPATARSSAALPPPVVTGERLAQVAWVNTKTALVTFGGAYTALPYLREQTVEHHGWLNDRAVIDALALGETTPGPLISVAIFLSYLAAGFQGAVVGCICLFFPAFVLVLGLGRYIDRVEKSRHARALLWGFSAGTLGLIVALAASVVPGSLPDLFSIAVAVAAFIAVWRFNANLLLVVITGGVLGVAWSLF